MVTLLGGNKDNCCGLTSIDVIYFCLFNMVISY